MTDYSRSVPAGVHQTIDSDKFKGHSTTSKPSDRIESPSEIRDSIQIMPESDHQVGPTEHCSIPGSRHGRQSSGRRYRNRAGRNNPKEFARSLICITARAKQSERNREFPHSRYGFKMRHIYCEYCAPCCNHDLTGFEWG